MATTTADFAAVVPWAGVRNRPTAFPTRLELIEQGDATDLQFVQWSQTLKQWVPVTVAPGSATWGSIAGTLSSQTDLQNALDLKADISSLAAVAFSGAYADLTGAPSSLPPSGAAGGDLGGTYPNPTLGLVGTAGKYQRVTTDSKGRVIAGYDDVVNVDDYGADPTGVANSTTAINNAIAALTSYSTLYLPGKYLVTPGSIGYIAGMDGITVMGDGWKSQLYSTTTGAPGNFLEIDGSCQFVKIVNLAIVGAATVRGSGVGLRLYSSDSQVSGCYFKGCSDFAIHVAGNGGGTAYSERVSVYGNHFDAPLGDGIHLGAVKDGLVYGNLLVNTGDDSIALVADDTAYPPLRCTVIGNHIYNAGARGITVLEAQDFLVADNHVYTSVLAGIEVNRFNSTSAYNTRGKVSGNKVYNSATTLGPIGAIGLYWVSQVECSDNYVDTPATGSGIAYLDVLNVTIKGNTIKGAPAYGIRNTNFGIAHVATTQGPLCIKDNVILSCTTNDGIQVTIDSGVTLYNLMVDGNEGYSIGSGTFITYDRINTGRIVNNTSFGSAITAGGTITAVTTANNN